MIILKREALKTSTQHPAYKVLQDKVYISLPPVVNIGVSLKRPETTQMGYFWSPLDSKAQDLTKKK